MLTYQEINEYARSMGYKAHLDTEFIAKLYQGPDEFDSACFAYIRMGDMYSHNVRSRSDDDVATDPNNLVEDMVSIAPTSYPTVGSILRLLSISDPQYIQFVHRCIELLFDIGVRYDGKKYNESNPKSDLEWVVAEDQSSTEEIEMDDDMRNFFDKLFGNN